MSAPAFGDSRLPQRFWDKCSVATGTGCWMWSACTCDGGYSRFDFDGSLRLGHRFAYQVLVGDVPDGLQLDHLCRTRNCVNPEHLEPVTGRVNILRGVSFAAKNAIKTHCKKGHPFDDDNVYLWRGSRYCVVCRADARSRYESKLKIIRLAACADLDQEGGA